MINKKDVAKLLLTATILGFSGCAQNSGPNFEQQADGFLKNRDYLKAIEYYEKSLVKNKDDKDILAKLKSAKNAYANYELGNYMREFSTQKSTFQLINELKEKSYRLKDYSSSEQITNFLGTLNQKEGDLKSQKNKLEALINRLSANNEYGLVVEKLNIIKGFDLEYSSSEFYKKNYKEAQDSYKKIIQNFLNDNDINRASDTFKEYAKIFDDKDSITELRELINNYIAINNKITNIKKFIVDNELNKAKELILGLKVLNLESEILNKEIKQVSSKLAKAYLNNAQEALADNKISIAYFQLLSAYEVKESVRFLSISKEILNKVYEKANIYKDMGLNGTAYALYSYINTIDKNFKSTFVLKRDVKDLLLKRNVLKLAISEFVTPDLNRNSGTRFTASLTSNLFKTSTKDVQVIERNRLKLILDELKLQETGNIETLAQQRGKIKGINVFVFGDIVESSIDPQRVETKVSKKIQIGTRKVSNPMYMVYYSKPSNERGDMKPPAQFIEEPEYQIISYSKGEIKKTANLIVSIRIVDIQKGEIIAAKTFEKQKVISDKYNEGVDFAGIKSDPEIIESDKTLMTEIQKELIDEISIFIMKSFENRENGSLEKAEFHTERREYTKSMEELVDTIIISEIKDIEVKDEVYQRKDEVFKELLR